MRADERAKPRISATAIAIPVAPDRKFWWVRPSIWVKYDNVLSPP
ncbi:Uncharacterised protein [Mycobacterium tuberculosis]|nr:Uncharacterised protein [Mycobacterium tuberculosis]